MKPSSISGKTVIMSILISVKVRCVKMGVSRNYRKLIRLRRMKVTDITISFQWVLLLSVIFL